MEGKIEIIDDVSFFLSLYKFFYLAFCSRWREGWRAILGTLVQF